GQPAGVRDLPHPDALPGHSPFPADGGGGAHPAPQLDPVRHGTRRLPPQTHDAAAARGRLLLVLPEAVLARLDLATAAQRPSGRPALPGDVIPVQALEPAVVFPDPPPLDGVGLAWAGRNDAPTSPQVPTPAGGRDGAGAVAFRLRGFGGGVTADTPKRGIRLQR